MKNQGIIARYAVIFFLGLGNLFIFYKILTPLTTISVFLILSLFSKTILSEGMIIFREQAIELIPACIAGSAYYLLFILNFSTADLNIVKRIKILFYSFFFLFILNNIRIVLLVLLLNTSLFEPLHLFFWYAVSTFFAAGIWIFLVRFFNINSIPVYSDVKYLLQNIAKNSKRAK